MPAQSLSAEREGRPPRPMSPSKPGQVFIICQQTPSRTAPTPPSLKSGSKGPRQEYFPGPWKQDEIPSPEDTQMMDWPLSLPWQVLVVHGGQGAGLPHSVCLSTFSSTDVLSPCLVPGIRPGPGHITHSPTLLSALN